MKTYGLNSIVKLLFRIITLGFAYDNGLVREFFAKYSQFKLAGIKSETFNFHEFPPESQSNSQLQGLQVFDHDLARSYQHTFARNTPDFIPYQPLPNVSPMFQRLQELIKGILRFLNSHPQHSTPHRLRYDLNNPDTIKLIRRLENFLLNCMYFTGFQQAGLAGEIDEVYQRLYDRCNLKSLVMILKGKFTYEECPGKLIQEIEINVPYGEVTDSRTWKNESVDSYLE